MTSLLHMLSSYSSGKPHPRDPQASGPRDRERSLKAAAGRGSAVLMSSSACFLSSFFSEFQLFGSPSSPGLESFETSPRGGLPFFLPLSAAVCVLWLSLLTEFDQEDVFFSNTLQRFSTEGDGRSLKVPGQIYVAVGVHRNASPPGYPVFCCVVG